MKRLLIILILVLALAIPTSAMAFDETGMSVSMGSQTSTKTIGYYDDDHDFDWNSIGIFGRTYSDNWFEYYFDYIDSELDIGYMKWTPKGNCDDSSVQTLSLEGRLMFMREIANYLSVGLGGGFAFLSDESDTYQLTEDGFYGLITGRIRLAFFSKPLNREWGIDLEADHISSVFGRDPGQNVWKARAYIMF